MHLGVRIASEPQGYLDPLSVLPSRAAAPVAPAPAPTDPGAGRTADQPSADATPPATSSPATGSPVSASPASALGSGGIDRPGSARHGFARHGAGRGDRRPRCALRVSAARRRIRARPSRMPRRNRPRSSSCAVRPSPSVGRESDGGTARGSGARSGHADGACRRIGALDAVRRPGLNARLGLDCTARCRSGDMICVSARGSERATLQPPCRRRSRLPAGSRGLVTSSRSSPASGRAVTSRGSARSAGALPPRAEASAPSDRRRAAVER